MSTNSYPLLWLAKEYLEYNPFFIYGGRNPLLHQTEVVSKSLFLEPTRILIADVIGLGKTITALRILKTLGRYLRISRVLLVVPSVLVDQWVDEAKSMGETLHVIDRRSLEFYTKLPKLPSGWYIGSMDTLKQPDYMSLLVRNRWDAIVVDEAHKLGMPGREPNIRWQNLGKLIMDNKDAIVLLLTATPHRGKANDYLSRLALIDPTLLKTTNVGALERVFDKPEFYRTTHNTILFRRSKDDVNKVFERRELFKPCNMLAVLVEPNESERRLVRTLTEITTTFLGKYYSYLMENYGWSVGRVQSIIALLRTLLVKRGLSSPQAVVKTFAKLIEKRGRITELIEKGYSFDEAKDIIGKELEGYSKKLDEVLTGDIGELEKELDDEFSKLASYLDIFGVEFRERMKTVVESAKDILSSRVLDSKVETLKRLLRTVLGSTHEELPEEFRDLASGKVIVFTEFKDTAYYLYDRIRRWAEREFGSGDIVRVFTSDNKHEIEDVKKWLAEEGKRVLITTDVAGEGLNLQYANVLANYEIAWSPIRLEQRIGRVWRYGQDKVTYVFNLFLADALEKEVAEVVFSKLYGITLSVGKLEPIIGEKVYLSTIRNELLEHVAKEPTRTPISGLVPLEIEFKGRRLSLSELRIIDLITRDARAFVESFIRALKRLIEEIRRKNIYPPSVRSDRVRRELKHLTGFSDTGEAQLTARELIRLVAKALGADVEEGKDRILIRFADGRVINIRNESPEKLLEGLLKHVGFQDYVKYFVFKDDAKKLLLLAEAEVLLGGEVRFREPIGILYKPVNEREFAILRGKELIEEVAKAIPLSIPVDEVFGLDDVLREVDTIIDTAHSTYYTEVLEKGALKVVDGVRKYEDVKAKLGGFKFFKVNAPTVRISEPKFIFVSTGFLPEVEEVPSEEVWGWSEDEAIPIVFNYEGLQGRSATRVSGYEHYDVKSVKRDSKGRVLVERFIEVKAKMGRSLAVKLTDEEVKIAKEKGDNYWLYLVYGVRSENPVILAIRNPLKRLPFKRKTAIEKREEYVLRL